MLASGLKNPESVCVGPGPLPEGVPEVGLLVEPINIFAGAIFFGTTLRAFYVVFLPDRDNAQKLMLEQNFAQLNAHVAWVMIGMIAFCIGYVMINFDRSRSRIGLFQPRRIEWPRLNAVMLACLAITIIGCAAYIAYFGIDLRGDILGQSHKRAVLLVGDLGDEEYASPWQVQLAHMGLFAGAVLAGAMISRNVRVTPYRLALMLALLAFGSVAPFFSSVRTTIILTVFSIIVFSYYYGKIKLRYVIAGLVAIGLFTSAMGEIRAFNSRGITGTDFLDNTVGSGNGFDTIRSAAIIQRVPERSPFLYGSSYLALPVFWVPRQLWPSKPETGLGAWVKQQLFGIPATSQLGGPRLCAPARRTGWPPGFVAEAYVNFGYAGIVIICLLIGMGMRWFYEVFRPYLGVSFLATTFYSLIVYKVGFDTPSLNIAQGVVTGLLTALPGTIMIYLGSRRIVRRPVARAPQRRSIYPPPQASLTDRA